MATAREVVKSALRKILGDTEDPSTGEMADGLEMLNDFMESLVLEGVVVAHQTLLLDDEINIDKAHIFGLKNIMAGKLAPEFGAVIDPQVAFDAGEAMKMLRSDTRLKRATRIDPALLRRNTW